MSSDFPDTGRQAAHVLLDTVSAMHAAPAARDPALKLGLRRLTEIGVIKATLDGETDELTIDLSDLAAGVNVTLEWLITALADATGNDYDTIVGHLKRFLDFAE